MLRLISILIFGIVFATSCSSKPREINVKYSNDKVKVTLSHRDSLFAEVNGTVVELESSCTSSEVTIRVSGNCADGRLVLKSAGKVKILLNNLSLTSNEGAPLWLKNKKRVVVEAMKNTHNTLVVTACRDTANLKPAVIWAKGKLYFSGKGTLDLLAKGDGCKGINAKGDIKIRNLTLNVITTGNNLGNEHKGFGGGFGGGFPGGDGGFPGGGFPGGFPGGNGGFPGGGFPGFGDATQDSTPKGFGGMPNFNFEELPDSVKEKIQEMRKNFEEGGFGGGFPVGGFGGMQSGDPDDTIQNEFKQRYVSPAKAIKSNGTVTIESGTIYCKTSSSGAEGIEGKKGVIINGGTVTIDAVDDA